ncbi:MAG: Lrp/AsnC family transcriptional regulator [Thermoanaerobacteraceae bacterium]|uniref:siroheme decarboxylase subunit beta n=1 Tax=Thermanaeromonas sp. C210 TaxID=2731925 RepID=UPI00155D36FC|nr:Lrp/AsnC family transcriptional regulator [Thermanaeromonas sp. C210]MBE3580979.1 Lrp/AsnC family transcriptional regulator [Thermoanaerobacteraceae bacterium]GFN23581.1 AsnC family transcriptional regulator [Thermanaeromonas sp. C210]
MEGPFSELEKNIVRFFQGDIPLEPRPFERAARELGISEDEVLDYLRRWQREGIIRRFGAALRHREAGIEANAMIVWQVPSEQIQAAGSRLASFPEVTHCYQRRTAPGWPYNLFAMVHGATRKECEALARRLAAAIDNYNYRILFSTAELKKESMRYFSD